MFLFSVEVDLQLMFQYLSGQFKPLISRVVSIFEVNKSTFGPVTLHGDNAGYRRLCSLMINPVTKTESTLFTLHCFGELYKAKLPSPGKNNYVIQYSTTVPPPPLAQKYRFLIHFPHRLFIKYLYKEAYIVDKANSGRDKS